MKFLVVVSLVVSLAVGLSACGSDSKKSAINQQAQLTQVPESRVDSSTQNFGKELNVAGKTCNDSGQNVTSDDLTETFVNTVCQFQRSANIYIDSYLDPNKPLEGNINFGSAKPITYVDGVSADLEFTVELSDCLDCPRQFYATAKFSKNSVGKWQIKSGTHVSFKEDEESKHSVISRHVKVVVPASYSIHLQSGQGYFELPVKVKGAPLQVFLQVQIDDGRIVEFESFDPRYEYFTAKSSTYDSRIETNVRLLAYSYRKDGFQPDWISLEAK